MAKVIMVQGTMSNAGKSFVVAGLCRVFRQDGYRVAPFKSQNMALNSFITEDGFEMGRAQVMQAEAAQIKPMVCMNPILLKPTNDFGSQVIVNGEVVGNMRARDYFAYKKELIPDIMKAFHKLEEVADIIVVEGAGSPAEINLKENDIVNMGLAKMLDAPVLLVGDIDRGGVFAQLLGTIMLLTDEERARVKGLVINKFRGDKTILDPGIDMLYEKAQIPITGVLPYIRVSIDDEDSLSERLDGRNAVVGSGVGRNIGRLISIAVVRLPRISNFSDFTVFETIEGVKINYTTNPEDIYDADMVIIPGSKNTIGDLKWMRESGMEAAIKKYSKDRIVFGICGGYQMLGEVISDPDFVEEGGEIRGMGLLKTKTVLRKDKTRRQVSGSFGELGGPLSVLSGKMVEGYEIHMGDTEKSEETGYVVAITREGSNCKMADEVTDCEKDELLDGAASGNVYGSYIHGIFDAGDIAFSIVETLAERKGVKFQGDAVKNYQEFKETQYDLLADMVREHMDMAAVYEMMGIKR